MVNKINISKKVYDNKIRAKFSKLILQTILFFIIMGSISIKATTKILLVIDGGNDGGWKDVVQYNFYYHPDEVWVNGVKHDICRQTCDLIPGLNEVTIKFDDQVQSCNQMFHNLNNIKEVDLSYFDASQVTDMKSMFHGCSNLVKVNFGNTIDTSKVF